MPLFRSATLCGRKQTTHASSKGSVTDKLCNTNMRRTASYCFINQKSSNKTKTACHGRQEGIHVHTLKRKKLSCKKYKKEKQLTRIESTPRSFQLVSLPGLYFPTYIYTSRCYLRPYDKNTVVQDIIRYLVVKSYLTRVPLKMKVVVCQVKVISLIQHIVGQP